MPTMATTFCPALNSEKERLPAGSVRVIVVAHQTCIRMISLNASMALLRTATVTWVVTDAWVAAIV